MARFVIYGAGAIGGVVGARLHQSGHEVVLIARGAHLEAIQTHGLTLTTPTEQVTLRITAASDPQQLGVGATDDVVLLAVKSQDTAGALQSLRAAGAGDVPIVCLQNGVENERVCARRFADVYGAVVMMPADHLRPGHVESYGVNASGIIDVGRYPAGVDECCQAIAAALSGSRIHSEPSPDVMRRKYAKLLRNLGNAVGALFGDAESARAELTERLRDEARSALNAAEIEYHDDVVDDIGARWQLLGVQPIGDRRRPGSSSWQSLARGAGTIETDYLNGEIVLLGRLHGVPTPFNEAICRLADNAVHNGARPGELSIDELFGGGALVSATIDPTIAAQAAEIADRAEAELAALVDVSSPSGDVPGAEAAIAVCIDLLPAGAEIERPPCSTAGSAPDLIATVRGTGDRRIMLLGHVDTVIGHDAHQPLRPDGERLYGTGTVDMKGGDVLAFGVARALAERPDRFAELAVLMVCDEEWRTTPFLHVDRFAGYDACLCFEAGHLTADGREGVVVKRKAAGTLLVDATGRAAHSGAAPDQGRNALLALARVADRVAAFHDTSGPEQLSVVPTVMRSGTAFNIVPAAGELICDMRARRLDAFVPVLASVPAELDEVVLNARMGREWPGMDSIAATAPVLEAASRRLGKPIVGVPRGGASDASHFAASIPLTIDGLGPRGGGAHTPGEFALREALGLRAEVALAIGHELVDGAES